MTSWLGEAQPYILWLSAEFAERLKCCLPEPKPFGTNPAAKMTLETKVSLARKRNTKYTKDREKRGKKKEKIFWLLSRSVSSYRLPLPQKADLIYFIAESRKISQELLLGYTFQIAVKLQASSFR